MGVVSRPLIGRVTIRGTFLDRAFTYREGDITSAASSAGEMTGYVLANFFGPLLMPFAALEGSIEAGEKASGYEEDLMRFDDIKKKLPRDSSALFLVADAKLCERFISAFQSYGPTVIRKELEAELTRRFEDLSRRVGNAFREAAAEHAPPVH
ncbi:MAG: DUF1269 domain-containing protein [Deltaproteobacteria bacterium]|nr:DUF1269 domain-containing protein [Deltaproteobacteria bacterium]